MDHARSSCARAAVVGLIGLALQALDVAVIVGGEEPYLQVLVLVQCLACSATAARMLHGNCFEARLAAVVIGLASAAGVVLAGTVGLPGRPAHGLGARDVASLALSAIVVVAVLLAARPRASRVPAAPPYAL